MDRKLEYQEINALKAELAKSDKVTQYFYTHNSVE